MLGFNRGLVYAVRNLFLLGAFLWVGGYLLAFSWPALMLHNVSIGTVPAHNFLDKIADLKFPSKNENVLFLGPSTVREGFEPKLIQERTGLYAVNGGLTSRGSIFHTEVQLDIVKNFNIKPDYLVLGINSRLLSMRPNPIGSTGFSRYLNDEQIAIQNSKEEGFSSALTAKVAFNNKVWPANQIVQRIDYVARFTLMIVNQGLGNLNEVKRSGFSRGHDALIIPAAYIYDDQKFNQTIFNKQWRTMEELGLFDPARYGTREDVDALNRVITKAIQLSPNVIIMVMPEHSRVRKHSGAWADTVFYSTIEKYRDQIYLVDYSEAIDDSLIRDFAHLVPEGRKELSILASVWMKDNILAVED